MKINKNFLKNYIEILKTKILFYNKNFQKLALDNIEGLQDAPKNSIIENIYLTRKSLMILFGICLGWSAFSKLDKSIVASGIFIPSSKKKIIQHLEGGIVESILVEEGDFVKKNQVLVKLNETSTRSNKEVAEDIYYSKIITKYRLEASLRLDRFLNIEDEALKKKINENEALQNKFNEEEEILRNFNDTYKEKISIIESKKKQNNEYVIGAKEKVEAITERIGLLTEEKKVLDILREKRLADHDRYLSVAKELATLHGEKRELMGNIRKLEENSKELTREITLFKENNHKELGEMLRKIEDEAIEAKSRVSVSNYNNERSEIKSPVNGIITTIKVNGPGHVINPVVNPDIAEIIPINDDLIVEAKINPRDISIIRTGLVAKIMPVIADQKLIPQIYGTVIHVAHDVQTEKANGQKFFEVKVIIPIKEFKKIPNHHNVVPGMHVNVFIKTGERSFLTYLFEPIIKSLMFSFNEM